MIEVSIYLDKLRISLQLIVISLRGRDLQWHFVDGVRSKNAVSFVRVPKRSMSARLCAKLPVLKSHCRTAEPLEIAYGVTIRQH